MCSIFKQKQSISVENLIGILEDILNPKEEFKKYMDPGFFRYYHEVSRSKKKHENICTRENGCDGSCGHVKQKSVGCGLWLLYAFNIVQSSWCKRSLWYRYEEEYD